MRLTRLTRVTNTYITTTEFRTFANIVSTMDLQTILNTAIDKIEAITNISLQSGTFRLESDASLEHKLYYNVSEVTSVTNDLGESVSYTLNSLKNRIYLTDESELVISYSVATTEDLCKSLKHYVYEYASALYDGQDGIIVLNKVPRNIC